MVHYPSPVLNCSDGMCQAEMKLYQCIIYDDTLLMKVSSLLGFEFLTIQDFKQECHFS